MNPLGNPIYYAPLHERLTDLKHICEVLLSLELNPDYSRPIDSETLAKEGLKPGEFAIGNWIVRPRFK